MNISSKEIEQIEAYLRQQLSPPEQQALEQRMLSDPAFRGEVELLRQIFAATGGDYPMRSAEQREALTNEIEMLEGDAEVAQLIQSFEEAERSKPAPPASSPRYPFSWLALAFLMLLVILSLGYYAYSQHSHKAYIQRAYLDTAPIDPKVAGGVQQGEENQLRLLRAEHLFFEQKHQEALEVLDSMELSMAMADYYRAQIYFQNGQFQAASYMFDLVISNRERSYIPTLRWHHLLARLGAGEDIEEDLEAYIRNPRNINFLIDKAKQLKSDLEQDPLWTQFGNFVGRWID